jgi:hypothetical protein
MSLIGRCFITLLFGYLCMVGVTAAFAFYQSVWGESYYMLNGDFAQNLFDQHGSAISTVQLAEYGLAWQNGQLFYAGQSMASYTDNQVTVFRPLETSFLLNPKMVSISALIAGLMVMVLIWKREIPSRLIQRLHSGLMWLRPLDIVVMAGLSMWCVLKTGVIDLPPLGVVVRGLQFGLNYYVHDILVGTTGRLTIFPYNPLSLFWLQSLAVMDRDFQMLGLHLRSYALVSLSIFVAYVWLCLELTASLRAGWRGSVRALFFLLLFNPFGLYYTIFLGQVDVITLALLVSGGRRLLGTKVRFSGLGMIILGLLFAKPQHALLLPAILISLFAARSNALKVRILWVATAVALAIISAYWLLYGLVPAFADSVATNPQAARIGWATWFHLFGDAVVINRPLAFMLICFLVLAYRSKIVADAYEAWKVVVLSIAALTAWFQASYAHTFGISILMYPAIMLMVTESEDYWRGAILWLSSILLLVGWGTGTVGDASQVLGLSLFTPERVHSLTLAGINYPSLLNTLETGAYIAFGVLLLMRLLFGVQCNSKQKY